MILKGILDEDFTNYKKASMYLAFPYCSFKCEKECGVKCCQNSKLVTDPGLDVDIVKLVERYLDNPITHAVVCAGLEPLDSFNDLVEFVQIFRKATNDDIVIYTGYKEEEVRDKIIELSQYSNILVKFGRFHPDENEHIDPILGVKLASANQYAMKIS